MTTINGTSLDDFLLGTLENDGIAGLEGSDVIFGGGGNDTLEGNLGDDFLFGEFGDDQLFGGGGRDLLDGGDGNDLGFGGNGNDVVAGGLGNDTLFGNAGNDIVNGQDGNDLINGGNGLDTLLGSLGNDTLFGGAQADRLLGGFGNDLLDGGSGNDTLIGVDTSNPNPGAFEVDILNGDEGSDTFVLGENDQVYYLGGGDSDYALITDFSIDEDVIQLAANPNANVTVAEIDDAGQLPPDVQVIAGGSGTLDAITGEIFPQDDVDVFQISLTGEDFFATTVGGAFFDTVLFLFDEDGTVIAGNDDSQGTLQSTLSLSGLEAGNYFLAVSSFANFPISDSLFDGFTGEGFDSGSYTVDLSGVQANAGFSLGASPTGLLSDTGVFAGNDLIAIIQDISPSELSLDSSNFTFV